MKKTRKMLALCMVFVLSVSTMPVNAVSNEYEALCRGVTNYSTEFDNDKAVNIDAAEIKDITLSYDNVILEIIGESVFVDAIAEMKDGSLVNVTTAVDWSSADNNVVTAYSGRILATGKGITTVSVKIGGLRKSINVNSLGATTAEKLAATLSADEPAMTSTQLRDEIIAKADDMTFCPWTVTQNLVGWRNQTTFVPGQTYFGVPYSQTPNQKDDTGFLNSLSASNFYSTYYNSKGYAMPRYGNDCSGFVSFAWGISRNTTDSFVEGIRNGTYSKVGSYNANSPSTSDLLNSYVGLQKGDGLVVQGHTFLVSVNDTANNRIFAYEQTPNTAQYTMWSYSDMASAKYMPFKLTYMDDPIGG